MLGMQTDRRTPQDIQRGERIRKEITRIGHNQSSIAIKLEMSQSTIAKYCSGLIVPSDESLKKLCEVFSVSSDYLLYGIESDIVVSHSPRNISKTLIHEDRHEDQDMTILKMFIESLQKQNEFLLRQIDENSKERAELRSENQALKNQITKLAEEIDNLKNNPPKIFSRASNGNSYPE